jgi:hypothetical protein
MCDILCTNCACLPIVSWIIRPSARLSFPRCRVPPPGSMSLKRSPPPQTSDLSSVPQRREAQGRRRPLPLSLSLSPSLPLSLSPSLSPVTGLEDLENTSTSLGEEREVKGLDRKVACGPWLGSFMTTTTTTNLDILIEHGTRPLPQVRYDIPAQEGGPAQSVNLS